MGGINDKSADGAPTTVNPVELALARARDGGDGAAVFDFLKRQETLIDAQVREAKAHVAQLGRQRWRDIIISLLGIAILATGGLFVWDASQARGVAIEPFRVPADMAARGLDGVVAATQVMDQLFAMQEATESIRAPSTYANNWGEDIAVEIPNTGVTVGDLRSSLRAWFGQQVRLSGEVIRLPDGQVAVTVRVGSGTAERFTGAENEFDALIRQAAESVYRQTQAYRYSIWLRNNDRVDEATQIVAGLAGSAKAEDRLWAINTLAARTEDVDAAILLHERGLRLDPNFTPILYNIANLESARGREGKALDYLSRLLAVEDTIRRQINPARLDQVLLSARSAHAALQQDIPQACALARQEMESASDRGSQLLIPLNVASCYSNARDVVAARQVLADLGLDDPARMAERIGLLAPDSEIESAIAMSLGDQEAAYRILKGVLVAISDPDLPYNLLIDQSILVKSYVAAAAAHTGRIAEAREIAATLPESCTSCIRASGLIEALAGNADAVRHLFGRAMEEGANLPTTYGEYAEALVILKDWHGAIAQAQTAMAMAPHWADPHMAWGDALMGLGEHRAAAGRYREAVRLAPNWGAGWIALGRAYAAGGDLKGARDAWTRGAALPLSPADQAEVTRLMARL